MTSPVQSLYNWYRQIIRNPKYRWWIILGTLVYLFSPIDILPDFFPFIGQIDDAVILSLLIAEVAQILGDRIKVNQERKVAQASETGNGSKTANADPVDVKAVSVE
jgi:uncharacterized membrane protein YkvA (DUF1232 family)